MEFWRRRNSRKPQIYVAIAVSVVAAAILVVGFQNCTGGFSASMLAAPVAASDLPISLGASPTPAPTATNPTAVMLSCGITDVRQQQIHGLFDQEMAKLSDSAGNAANYPQVVYDLQEITAAPLQAADNCGDIYMLDGLAKLYAIAFGFLQTGPSGDMVWLDNTNHEIVLDSTQFMFAVAKLINVIVHTDQSKWTTAMHSFVYSEPNGPRQYLIAHLNRWLNQRSMWTYTQCGYTQVDNLLEYTFPDYVQKKTAHALGYAAGAPVYCNMIQEPEIWIGAAATELLDAENKSDYWIGLSPTLAAQMKSYAQASTHLLETRISTTPACSDGTCVGGLLDLGGQHGHPEYPANLWPNGGEVWDFSHMRRMVQWIDTLYSHTDITNGTYDLVGLTQLFANEVAYTIFNGSYTDPAFTNFWNGYNVIYPRVNITYQPYDLSSSYWRSGYGFWALHQSDIGRINSALLLIADNQTPTSHMPIDPTTSDGLFDLLGFLSSLTHPSP